MVAGVGVATALATSGALAHVFNHVLYKALLFMVVGVLVARTGRERLSDLGGLGRRMPLLAGVFTVAALSIAGFPGFNGFVSKGMLLDAAQYGGFEGVFWLLTIAGVGTFVSFAKLGYYAFVRPAPDGFDADAVGDVSLARATPLVGLAGLCVLFGLAPGLLFGLLDGAGTLDLKPYSASHLAKGVAVAGVGAVAFVALKRPLKHVGRLPDVDAVYNPVVFHGTRATVAGLGRLGTLSRTARHRAADGWDALGALLTRADASTDVGRAVLVVSGVLALALLASLA
jgi:multicomponent Na+:H+ antiporter subunit D